MKEKYLPIGTVVLLTNGTKKVMITGYLPIDIEAGNKMYDYTGCLFPEGVIIDSETLAFNHDQIQEIVYEGLNNEESGEFIKTIKNIANINNQPTVNSALEQQKTTEEKPAVEAPVQAEKPAPAETSEPVAAPAQSEEPTPIEASAPVETSTPTVEPAPTNEPAPVEETETLGEEPVPSAPMSQVTPASAPAQPAIAQPIPISNIPNTIQIQSEQPVGQGPVAQPMQAQEEIVPFGGN